MNVFHMLYANVSIGREGKFQKKIFFRKKNFLIFTYTISRPLEDVRHFRGVSIFEATNKKPKGKRSRTPTLC